MIDLALATRIGPEEWHATMQRDPRLVVTALHALDEQAQKAERAAKRRR